MARQLAENEGGRWRRGAVIAFPAMTNKKARQACAAGQREILIMTILGEAQATHNSGGGIDPIERARRDGLLKDGGA
jgi:hypothetical protein